MLQTLIKDIISQIMRDITDHKFKSDCFFAILGKELGPKRHHNYFYFHLKILY